MNEVPDFKTQIEEEQDRIRVRYSNLFDKLGMTPEDQQQLFEMKLKHSFQIIMFAQAIVRNGGNLHHVNEKATAKRHAANKRARKQRRLTRGR